MLHQDSSLDRFAQELVTTQFLVYSPLTQSQALQWLDFLEALLSPLEALKTQELLPETSFPAFALLTCPVQDNPTLSDKWTSLADPVLILGITPSQWPQFCDYLLTQIRLCLPRDRALYLQSPDFSLSYLLADLVLASPSPPAIFPSLSRGLAGLPSLRAPHHLSRLSQNSPNSPHSSTYSEIQEGLFQEEDEGGLDRSDYSSLPLIQAFSSNSSPSLSNPSSPALEVVALPEGDLLGSAYTAPSILARPPSPLESMHQGFAQPALAAPYQSLSSNSPGSEQAYHYPQLLSLSQAYQNLRTHAPSPALLAIESQLMASLDSHISLPLWTNICETLRKEAVKLQLQSKAAATVDRLSTYKHPWLYTASLKFTHVDWSEEKQAFEQQMWFLDDSPAPLIHKLFASDSFSKCMLSGNVSWIATSILFSLTEPQGPLPIEWLSLWLECDSVCQQDFPSRSSCQILLHKMAQIHCSTPAPSLLYALRDYVRAQTPEPSVSSPSSQIRPFGAPLSEGASHATEDVLLSSLWLEEMLDSDLGIDLDLHWLLHFLHLQISQSPERLSEHLSQIVLALLSFHKQNEDPSLQAEILQTLGSITQNPSCHQNLQESLSLLLPSCAHRDLALPPPLLPYARLYASTRKKKSSLLPLTSLSPEPTPLLDWLTHLLEDYPLPPFQMIQSLVAQGLCEPEVGEELYLLIFHGFSNFQYEAFLEFCNAYSPSNPPPITLLRYVAIKPNLLSYPILQRLLLAFDNPQNIQESSYPLLLVQSAIQRSSRPLSPIFIATQNFMLHFAQDFPLSLKLDSAQEDHSLPRSFLLALATRTSLELWNVLPLETLYASSPEELTIVFQSLAHNPEATDFLHHLMNLSNYGDVVAINFTPQLVNAKAWGLLLDLRSSSVRYQPHAELILHRLLWQLLQLALSGCSFSPHDLELIDQILFSRLSDLYDWAPFDSSASCSLGLPPSDSLPSLASWIAHNKDSLPDLYQQLRLHTLKTSIFCDPAFSLQAQHNPLFFQQLCSLSRVEHSLWWEYIHSPKDWPLRASYKTLFLQNVLSKELTLIHQAVLSFERSGVSNTDDPLALFLPYSPRPFSYAPSSSLIPFCEPHFSAPLTFSSPRPSLLSLASPRLTLEESAYWARTPWLHSQFLDLPIDERQDCLQYVRSLDSDGEPVFQSALFQSLFTAQALSWSLLITIAPTFAHLDSLLSQSQQILAMKPGLHKLSALRSLVSAVVHAPSVPLVKYLYQHPLSRFPSFSSNHPFPLWPLFDDETFFFSSHIETPSSPRKISPQWLQYWLSRRLACEEFFAISEKASALVRWTLANIQSSPSEFTALWRRLFAACDLSIQRSSHSADILKKRTIKRLVHSLHSSLIQQSSQTALLPPPLLVEALQLYAQWYGLSSLQYLSQLLTPTAPPSTPDIPLSVIEAVLRSSWCDRSQALDAFTLCVPKISPLALSSLVAPSLWAQACSDLDHPLWALVLQNLHTDSAAFLGSLNEISPAPIAFILTSWTVQHQQYLDEIFPKDSRHQKVLGRKRSGALSLTETFLVSLMKHFPLHPALLQFFQEDSFWGLLSRTHQSMLFEAILEASPSDLPWLASFLQRFRGFHQQKRLQPYLSAILHFPTLSVLQKSEILSLIVEIEDESLLSCALSLYKHVLPGTFLQHFLWELHNNPKKTALYEVFFKHCRCTAYLPLPQDQGHLTLAAKMQADPKLQRYSYEHPLWQRLFHHYPQHSKEDLAHDLIQTPIVILGLWESVARQVYYGLPPCEASLRLIEEFLEIAPLEKMRSLYIAHLLPYTLNNPLALAQFVISKIFFLYHIKNDPQGFSAWTTPIRQGVSHSHSPLGQVLTSPHIDGSLKQTFIAKCLLFGQLYTHLNQDYPLELGSLVAQEQEKPDRNARKREKKSHF